MKKPAAILPASPPSPWTHPVWREPVVRVCAALLGLLVFGAVFGPLLSPYEFNEICGPPLQGPSLAHWAGTDVHGFDLFTRMLIGARISLLVGCIGAAVSLTVGVVFGLVAGYVGGAADLMLMRIVDVLYSLPRLVFVIVLMAALEKPSDVWVERVLRPTGVDVPAVVPYARLGLLFLFLGLVEWMTMSRIVRGQVLVLREQGFIQAARALGQGHLRILTRHLLPNIAGIIIVYLTLTIPVIILEESFLSFLGLGVRPPLASWGSLIADGAKYLNPVDTTWWLLLFPAAMMSATLLALNFLGDALRDAFDPRSRRE